MAESSRAKVTGRDFKGAGIGAAVGGAALTKWQTLKPSVELAARVKR